MYIKTLNKSLKLENVYNGYIEKNRKNRQRRQERMKERKHNDIKDNNVVT